MQSRSCNSDHIFASVIVVLQRIRNVRQAASHLFSNVASRILDYMHVEQSCAVVFVLNSIRFSKARIKFWKSIGSPLKVVISGCGGNISAKLWRRCNKSCSIWFATPLGSIISSFEAPAVLVDADILSFLPSMEGICMAGVFVGSILVVPFLGLIFATHMENRLRQQSSANLHHVGCSIVRRLAYIAEYH